MTVGCGFTNVPDPGTMADESAVPGRVWPDGDTLQTDDYDAGIELEPTEPEQLADDGIDTHRGGGSCADSDVADGGPPDVGDLRDADPLYDTIDDGGTDAGLVQDCNAAATNP